MKTLISNFTKQIAESITIGKSSQISPSKNDIKNILVSGLGGSGIGANLVSQIVSDKIQIPFLVNKDYSLPEFVNENSLIIISSYSGNTEETISAMNQAIKKNAKIVCITSGGKVLETAKQNGFDYIQIPGGMPPRTCIAYSFIQQLYILKGMKLLKHPFEEQLQKAIALLDKEEENIKLTAKNIAKQIFNKLPVIYVCSGMESVALRLRQQLNENAKMLATHHVIPEMNHNELVGWRTKNENIAVLILRNEDDFIRNQQRIEICKEIISGYTSTIIQIYSQGNSFIEKALYQIHIGDWISYFCAENRKMDATEVNVIDRLKGELLKLN